MSKLIILRGNSGSGKSTLDAARKIGNNYQINKGKITILTNEMIS